MKKIFISLAALFTVATATAQDELTVSGGADFVSTYVWRGVDQSTGPSIQPGLAVAYKGVSLGAWGSTPLEFSNCSQELDFYVGYEIGNFSAMVSDYWWMGSGSKFYGKESGHIYEVTLAYTICESFPLNISANVMVAGSGDLNTDDKQNYSTYIALSYPFTIGEVECSATVGLTPNGTVQYCTKDDFGVNNVALRADYGIKITEDFSLPIFCELSTNPCMNDDCVTADGKAAVNAVVGISLGF